MTTIAAQISLYPLGEVEIAPAVDKALRVLEKHNLDFQKGEMSTIVVGKTAEVFDGLRDVFQHADKNGAAVMTITISNACPVTATPAA